MRVARALALVLLALAFGLAGCGGGGGDEEAAEPGPAGPVDGAAVWIEAGCADCHTLAAAFASGTTAPNLDKVKPSQEEVAQQVREGGGGMPSFEAQLSDEEIEAVAQYVAQSAGG